MPSEQTLFWQLKWHIRDALLKQFNPDRLRLVQIPERQVRRFLLELVTETVPDLDPVVIDCLIAELIKEFFSERPLIKATTL
jgi:hypothetical protein